MRCDARWISCSSGAPANNPETLGYPRAFKVEVSDDGAAWKTVADASATGLSTTVTFSPSEASRLRIRLTGAPQNSPPWSLQELKVFALQRQ